MYAVSHTVLVPLLRLPFIWIIPIHPLKPRSPDVPSSKPLLTSLKIWPDACSVGRHDDLGMF